MIYWTSRSRFYENGGLSGYSTWSLDVFIPPQTVYAFASLSNVLIDDSGGGVFCGVSLYFMEFEIDGVKVLEPRFPSPTNNGVAPAIWDVNVVTVSFMYGALYAAGDCSFQVLPG